MAAGPAAAAAAATDQPGGSSESADRGAECVRRSGLGVGSDGRHGDTITSASAGNCHTPVHADVCSYANYNTSWRRRRWSGTSASSCVD